MAKAWQYILFLIAGVCLAGVVRASQPNFVVIIADDLGATDLGTYGHPVVRTPKLDLLAREGMQFNHAFLTTSSCTASRASILTGRYPHHSGAARLHDVLPAEQPLVTTHLRAAGYYTAAIGKWHLGEPAMAHFDKVVDPPGDAGTEGWVQALRERPAGKPFFFWLASRDPHVPYSPLAPGGPYQPEDAVILPVFYDTPGTRENIVQYYTEITRLDAYVGQVVDALREQGVLDNTYVIFLSDNGAPMPRAKTTLYDAGIRTPLILRGPQIKPGVRVDALVSVIDLMPTVLALAGVPVPADMDGQSMLPLWQQKPGARGREAVFAQQFDHGFRLDKRAVRTRDHLYIRNIGENKVNCLLEVQPMGQELQQAFRERKLTPAQSLCFGGKLPEEELYDVNADPLQLDNLAGKPAHQATRKRLREWVGNQARQFRDTGYPAE